MPTSHIESPLLSTKSASYTIRSREWARTPNYRTVPKDLLRTLPYTDNQLKLYQNTPTASYTMVNSTGVKTYRTDGGAALTGTTINNIRGNFYTYCALTSDFSAADGRNLIQLYGRVADSKVNLAVTFAEAGKAMNLVLSTASRIDRAYRALRRGQFSKTADLLGITSKKVHKTWLEYKYGWMPLLMDVHGAAEALAQQHVGRPPRFKAKSSTELVYSRSRTTSYTPWGGGAPGSYTESLSGTYRTKHAMWLEVTSSAFSTANQLGLTNPALFVWELIPYSFVFDWFVDVGGYLGALTALDGLNVRDTLRSSEMDYTYVYNDPGSTRVSGGVTYVARPYLLTAVPQRYYSRSQFTVDLLSLYPPRKVQPLNIQKAITSLALLRGSHRSTTRT